MADFCLCMKRSEPESEGKKMRKIIECMIHRERKLKLIKINTILCINIFKIYC